ncbi:unnamed protein product, partial [marine sediment metagenome]
VDVHVIVCEEPACHELEDVGLVTVIVSGSGAVI